MTIQYIDLFAGIGGFHYAANDFDWECVWACEYDPATAATYELNHGIKPWADIHEISISDIPDCQLVFAGFPCQPFSRLGQQKGMGDYRSNVFWPLVEIIRDKQPDYFILENVLGITNIDEGKPWATIMGALDSLPGYQVTILVMNAMDYGLPQSRTRVFFIGEKNGFWGLHKPPKQATPPVKPYLEPVQELPDWVFKLMKSGPFPPGKVKPIKGYGDCWDTTSAVEFTIRTPYMPCITTSSHRSQLWRAQRFFSHRERHRMQGFPEHHQIPIHNKTLAAKQAGNAVPPPLVKTVLQLLPINQPTTIYSMPIGATQ